MIADARSDWPAPPGFLEEPLLRERGIVHGFGQRGARAPQGTAFARQVHGRRVALAERWPEAARPEADAVLTSSQAPRVGIVTADCVPVLACSESGAQAIAIHAGWRGLAAGVVEAGIARLDEAAGGGALLAAIGPCAGVCCYEVDAPVLEALRARYADPMGAAGCCIETRPGHARIDLARLVAAALEASGVVSAHIGRSCTVCSLCDPARFESHRRDGATAGRMPHFIEARTAISREG